LRNPAGRTWFVDSDLKGGDLPQAALEE
jgi:hypothetical protein